MQVDEHIVVQAFVTEFAVKALDVSVLSRFARLDESEFDVVIISPEIKRLADELRAVIDCYGFRKPTCKCNSLKDSGCLLYTSDAADE